MAKDFDAMESSNGSANPSIHDVSLPERRQLLQGGAGVLAGAMFAPMLAGLGGCATAQGLGGPKLGFKAIPPGMGDALVVPEGYVAEALAAWGEPVGIAGAMPAWRDDASNSAADQAVQMGMHHDGLHVYSLSGSSSRGLLVMNHEYPDDGLLHPDGMKTWTAERC